MEKISLQSFPKAIVHIDGDCFFASCEVARNPKLRGKSVVTGKERGIASSFTYEAKARGVKRGMRLSEIKKLCPDAIFLPSDYETYSLYSKRMFEIVRRYTPDVDEYSIDECFADITGLRRSLRLTYTQIAEKIKYDLDNELGMTFSVGLSVNKVTAKIASKWKKPSGLTVIPLHNLHLFLDKLQTDKIWGIGPQTGAHLSKLRVYTALDFALKDLEWVEKNFTKPQIEIWRELHGEFVYPLNTEEKHDYQSISKTRTFTPPSANKEVVFSELSKNVESACIKLRRHTLFTKEVFFYLKRQDFGYAGLEIKLPFPVSVPQVIIRSIRESFDKVYQKNTLYRATGVVLMKLSNGNTTTMDLFGESLVEDKISKVYEQVDAVEKKYGKHTLFLGSSFSAMKNDQHEGDRGTLTDRKRFRLKGETVRKHLNIPNLGKVK